MNRGLAFDFHQRVGYADVDRMGFVHHSRYFVYLETARTELLRAAGMSYLEWEERGVLLPLTSCSIRYRRAARYDDLLLIRTHLIELTRLRVAFEYDVTVGGGDALQAIANGRTDHVFMNSAGRPMRAPAELLEMLEPYRPKSG
jgi:acyl-CoA thioester hydrolase